MKFMNSKRKRAEFVSIFFSFADYFFHFTVVIKLSFKTTIG